jgi:UDP-N-acetylglucosamine 2-epimerase
MSVQKNVLVVFGTRPETIKLAPVIRALQNDARFNAKVIFTGQHKEMVQPLLDWFNIKPDYTLDVMAHKQPLAHLSGKLLYGLHTIIEKERPDTLVVQGDTTTTFMAALTAYYGYDFYVRNDIEDQRRKIDIAHIEAGLRTYDNYGPFPEEVNRRLVGHMATHHFAPTLTAATALYDENVTENVFITGNTAIDTLFDTVKLLEQKPLPALPELAELPEDARFVLITGHRRESYGEGFDHICRAIRNLAEKYPHDYFVYPVHLNRHVHDPVMTHLGNVKNIILTEPLDYPYFISLMQKCYLLLTDSGGLQEEGPSLGKPVLVMRELTERPEAVLAGTAKVVGTSTQKIVGEVRRLMDDKNAYNKMAHAVNPYGDGFATRRILNIMAGEPADENMFTFSAAA